MPLSAMIDPSHIPKKGLESQGNSSTKDSYNHEKSDNRPEYYSAESEVCFPFTGDWVFGFRSLPIFSALPHREVKPDCEEEKR